MNREDIRLTPEKRKGITEEYYRKNPTIIDDNAFTKLIANAATDKANDNWLEWGEEDCVGHGFIKKRGDCILCWRERKSMIKE